MSHLTRAELDAIANVLTRAGAEVTGPLKSRLIAGGKSNLTFGLTDGRTEWVTRTPPRAGRTPSAHDVVREYRVTRALHATGFPVPPAIAVHEDDDLIGGPFAVWEFVPGRTVQSAEQLRELSDAQVAATVSALIHTLASLHAIDYRAVGLGAFGRPDGYAARQVKRWAGQWTIVGEQFDEGTRDAAIRLADSIGEDLPRQHSSGIVHGDYRIDNTLLRFEGSAARVAAVLDWELSTIGDPAADVAMMCVYRHTAFDLIVGAPSAWASDRLPDATSLAEAYEKAGGVRLVDFERQLALAYFKLAVIGAGIDHRYRAGATHGEGFGSAGQAVRPLMEAGLELLAGLRDR